MGNEVSNKEEFFEDSLRIFIFSLQILSHDAETQCEEMGNYNTAWEIQHDVSAGGLSLLRSSVSYLSIEQAEGIKKLADALKKLPEEAITPSHLAITSHAGCLAAMSHPAWEPFRSQAAQLLMLLEPAIKRNEAYYKK